MSDRSTVAQGRWVQWQVGLVEETVEHELGRPEDGNFPSEALHRWSWDRLLSRRRQANGLHGTFYIIFRRVLSIPKLWLSHERFSCPFLQNMIERQRMRPRNSVDACIVLCSQRYKISNDALRSFRFAPQRSLLQPCNPNADSVHTSVLRLDQEASCYHGVGGLSNCTIYPRCVRIAFCPKSGMLRVGLKCKNHTHTQYACFLIVSLQLPFAFQQRILQQRLT